MTNNTDPNTTILLIGASGLIGSRLHEMLSSNFTIETASYSSGLDITRPETLSSIKESSSSVVIHLAAKTDVDGCERDKALGEDGDAWKLNVIGAQNVANVCKETGKKMIYFSTDFVFDGKKDPPFLYAEEDEASPVNWYATTKYEGENKVRESGADYIICRTAYPYRAHFAAKNDFVRAIKSRLEANQPVRAVTDHIMSPTYIDDIAEALAALIQNDARGIYHVVGSSHLSPFDAARMISREFKLDSSLISQTTREAFFRDRAKRPFNLGLKNDKIHTLGVRMRTFEDGLRDMNTHVNSL